MDVGVDPEPRPSPERPRLCLVVPCYNEEEVLAGTIRALDEMLVGLAEQGTISDRSYALYVDDGSKDATWSIILDEAGRNGRVAGIRLSRNRGHQRALLAGLHNADADATISVDADLQDDLAVVPQMLAAFVAGSDVVLGVRADRESDSWFKRSAAVAFYRLLRALGADVVENHADFRLLSRRALGSLRQFSESNVYLRGLIPMLGYPTSIVHYTRLPRTAGVSKYPLRRMLHLAWEGVTSLTATPLRIITVVGALASLLATGLAIWVVWARFFSAGVVPGWASTLLPILLLGALQLLSIGVLGEYVAKVYMETKNRPPYFVQDRAGSW